MGVDLALVVGRAAGEHPAVDDHRLERRRRPQLDGIDRLDVVVAVDEHGRRIGRVEPVRVDDGMAAGLERLGVLDAGRCQRVGQPLGRAPAVGGVRGDAGDARDAQEVLVRLDAFVVRRLEMGGKGVDGGVGGRVRGRGGVRVSHVLDCRGARRGRNRNERTVSGPLVGCGW